jgi:TatD DNase family protein
LWLFKQKSHLLFLVIALECRKNHKNESFTLTNIPFINIHTHRKPLSPSEKAIRNAYLSLSEAQLDTIPYAVSAGIHPWFIKKETLTEDLATLTTLSSHHKVWAVGEMGLDKSISVPFSLQKEVFENQLFIAEKIKKPIIIHAVKTYSEFIPYLKKATIPFIFHFFMGNETEAKSLLKYENVYLSFGKNFFLPHQKSLAVFEKIPISRLFLETDVMPISIEKVYEKAAELRKMEIEELMAQINENFQTILS